MSDKLKIGDFVNINGTTHYSKISFIGKRGWIALEQKAPTHCCNHYSKKELTKIEPQKVRPHRIDLITKKPV